MAITTVEQEVAKLRSYLNPLIQGPTTNALIYALASGYSSYLVNQADAVQQQLYFATASGIYLDRLASEINVTRPPNLGVPDQEFSEIALAIKNTKQIRTLINEILNIIYGDQLTKASDASTQYEPYDLADQDNLLIGFDGKPPVNVILNASQFANVNAALAQEVADAISSNLIAMGLQGYAVSQNDGNGNYVRIYSDTIGPASSVTVFGGSAQNKLIFPSPVGAGGNMSTQWTISNGEGGYLKFTWTGGANPNLGIVNVGNYVNIFGGGFTSSSNVGSYTITSVVGGAQDVSYFEIYNPLGSPGIVVQGADNAVLFFNPVQEKITNQQNYAAQFQVSPRTVQIFLPVTSKVIRREREGSMHLNNDSFAETLAGQPGPYLYDLTQPFVVSGIQTTLTQNLNGFDSKLIQVTDSSAFPDKPGYLVFGYGTAEQEGPVPYISTPSSTTILLSPAYTLKDSFTTGAYVNFIESLSPVALPIDGSGFDAFLTSDSAGTAWAESLIQLISAAGLTLTFFLIYPSDVGLGKWGTPFSEIKFIYSQ